MYAKFDELGVQVLDENNPVVYFEDQGQKFAIIGVPGVLPHDLHNKIKHLPKPKKIQMYQEKTNELYMDSVRRALREAEEEDAVVIALTHVPPTGACYGQEHDGESGEMTDEYISALDSKNVLAVIHGHLHEPPYDKTTVVWTKDGIVVANVAVGIHDGPLVFYLTAKANFARARREIAEIAA